MVRDIIPEWNDVASGELETARQVMHSLLEALTSGEEFASLTPSQREIVRKEFCSMVTKELADEVFYRPFSTTDPVFPMEDTREKEEKVFLIPRWDGVVISLPSTQEHYSIGDPFEFYLHVRRIEWRESSRLAQHTQINEHVVLQHMLNVGDRARLSNVFEFSREDLVSFLEQILPPLGRLIVKEHDMRLWLYVEYFHTPGKRQLIQTREVPVLLTKNSPDVRQVLSTYFSDKLLDAAIFE